MERKIHFDQLAPIRTWELGRDELKKDIIVFLEPYLHIEKPLEQEGFHRGMAELARRLISELKKHE